MARAASRAKSAGELSISGFGRMWLLGAAFGARRLGHRVIWVRIRHQNRPHAPVVSGGDGRRDGGERESERREGDVRRGASEKNEGDGASDGRHLPTRREGRDRQERRAGFENETEGKPDVGHGVGEETIDGAISDELPEG